MGSGYFDPVSIDELVEVVRAEGWYLCPKVSADRRQVVAIAPMIFTAAIITMTDNTGYNDRWCYADVASAKAALDAWSGNIGTEPDGWKRHPRTGRRRTDGDPAREYYLV